MQALLEVRRDLEWKGEIGVRAEQQTEQTEVSYARPVQIRTAPEASPSPAPANDASAEMPTLEKKPPRNDPYREPVSMERAPTSEPEPSDAPEQAEPAPQAVPQERVVEAANDAAAEQQPNEALYRPEVTQGLEQLLSEWGIFKRKEGMLGRLLGIGSVGIEHGLYQQIASMPVLDVLAGGKKGVSVPAYAVKDIRAYVAGWKEDYGIEPAAGETFELYLRRMIDHILSEETSSRSSATPPAEDAGQPLAEAA